MDILPFKDASEREASFDLCDLINEIGESFEDTCEQRGIGLDLDVPPHTIVEADQRQIYSLVETVVDGLVESASFGENVSIVVDEGPVGVEIELASNSQHVPATPLRLFAPMQVEAEEDRVDTDDTLLQKLAIRQGGSVAVSQSKEGTLAITIQLRSAADVLEDETSISKAA